MGDLGNETAAAESVIAISLARLQQLFNSFDPSPFPDRDLDHDAEEYIVGWAEEIALYRLLRLIIHLPPNEEAKADQLTAEVRSPWAIPSCADCVQAPQGDPEVSP
jgi:hypothetical protein